MKYLIIGNKGQLGKEFEKTLSNNGFVLTGVDFDELDISDLSAVMSFFKSVRPEVVINCSAYNFVDLAENNFYDALKSNTFGVKNLAYACSNFNSFFVHYSSDYVFDGTKETNLYTEDDKTNPINNYGISKLFGEYVIPEVTDNFLIFRLSWVFGRGTQNFIYKLLSWLNNSEFLKIANDEISIPTSTKAVVDVTLKAIKENLTGKYHLTCSEFTSRYEWAKFILKCINSDKYIYPVSKEIFDLPAKRPYFSAMSNDKISSLLNIEIPTWQEEVELFLKSYYNGNQLVY